MDHNAAFSVALWVIALNQLSEHRTTQHFFIKLAKSLKGKVMLKGVYINGTNQGYTASSLKYVISAKNICSPQWPLAQAEL